MNTTNKKPNLLAAEMLKCTGISVLIFTALFAVLAIVEWLFPELKGTLLQWHSAPYIVGIPASVFGVGYVLTIRNPKNYLGFYMGIVMAALLSVQFYLQENYDLTVLYIALFIPLNIMAIVTWRKGESDARAEVLPHFVPCCKMLLIVLSMLLILALDYVLDTLVIYQDGWTDSMAIKLLSGMLIASSVLANILMIYKTNDAWVCWVVYSVAGILFYILVNNMFSIVLFTVFLVINSTALIAWIRDTRSEDFGWMTWAVTKR